MFCFLFFYVLVNLQYSDKTVLIKSVSGYTVYLWVISAVGKACGVILTAYLGLLICI